MRRCARLFVLEAHAGGRRLDIPPALRSTTTGMARGRRACVQQTQAGELTGRMRPHVPGRARSLYVAWPTYERVSIIPQPAAIRAEKERILDRHEKRWLPCVKSHLNPASRTLRQRLPR